MFAHARRRLTVAYIAMFALVVGVFSLAFLVLIAIVLEPNFDLAPDTSSQQAVQIAYDAAVARIGLALAAADVVAVAVVGIGAWLLAARTLRPIGDAHERQRRFVADASHEMRTPLTAIRATTENALGHDSTEAEQRAALTTVATASAELGRLTADLLTLAQGDDPAQRSAQHFDLSVVVAERLALRATSHTPPPSELHLAPDLVVKGSPDEIGRICDNLVDNAFRYGGPAGHVSIRTWSADHQALLEVGDDGPGIALADQGHVFDAFYRVHADASAPAGTGLGLAIALALARRNHGRLILSSRPGRGSTFRLQLPLAT